MLAAPRRRGVAFPHFRRIPLEIAAKRRCDHCAHMVEAGAAFCTSCGAVCPWNIPTEVHRAEEVEAPAFVLVYIPGGSVRKESLHAGAASATGDATSREWRVGRSDRCAIVVDHPQVSRHHATIRRNGAAYTIEDARSSGGTFVNDRPVHGPTRLKPGDTCRLSRGPGPAPALVYHEEGEEIAPPGPSGT
jgi:hypothetical protein